MQCALHTTSSVESVGTIPDTNRELLRTGSNPGGPYELESSYLIVPVVDGEAVTEEGVEAQLISRRKPAPMMGYTPLGEIRIGDLKLTGIHNLSLEQKEMCLLALAELLQRFEEG